MAGLIAPLLGASRSWLLGLSPLQHRGPTDPGARCSLPEMLWLTLPRSVMPYLAERLASFRKSEEALAKDGDVRQG